MSNGGCVGYVRVSQESDQSIDTQKRRIKKYCDERGLDLKRVFNDGTHSSGYDTDRPQYQELVDTVKAGKVNNVIVYDTTRLGREYLEIMRFYRYCIQYDVTLHTVKDGIIELDETEPMKLALESVKAASNDQQKRVEIEKAKEVTQWRQDQGFYQGYPPFGLQFDTDGRYLVPCPAEWDQLVEVLALKDAGYSHREVVEEVDGVNSAGTVTQILDRKHKYVEVADRCDKHLPV